MTSRLHLQQLCSACMSVPTHLGGTVRPVGVVRVVVTAAAVGVVGVRHARGTVGVGVVGGAVATIVVRGGRGGGA